MPRSFKLVRPRAAAAAAVLIAALPAVGLAHEIPTDVTVQAFVRPAGRTLDLVVRVPLAAMRDIEFPKRGPGFLDLPRVDASLRQAARLWLGDAVELYEAGTRLANPRVAEVRVALESDRSFASYEEALAHVTGARLPNETEVYWNQAMLDVRLEYPIRSDKSEFSIRPAFARLGLRVITALRFVPPSGVVRALELTGDPGLVRLDPRWHQAASRFVGLGFLHILDGTDHLLFLLCLVIPLRRIRRLVLVVTSFTVAHSITLIASAYELGPDALWFPPLIETLIAVSIVYMALENIVGNMAASVARRWIVAFGFGLVHGFGFSFALRHTMQFAGSHVVMSLLAFNLGVELGQLLVLALLVPALAALFRFVVAERVGTIVLSALVAHTGWHWMIERADRLRRFPRPALDAALVLAAVRGLLLVVILGTAVWLVSVLLRQRAERSAASKAAVGTQE